MSWDSPRDTNAASRLEVFGRNLRRARRCAGLSQQRLSDLCGVSQSVISRLERARAPQFALERLLAIQEVLGGCLPLGLCPHDHACIWQPLWPEDHRLRHRPQAVPGLSWPWRADEPWRADFEDRLSASPTDEPTAQSPWPD